MKFLRTERIGTYQRPFGENVVLHKGYLTGGRISIFYKENGKIKHPPLNQFNSGWVKIEEYGE